MQIQASIWGGVIFDNAFLLLTALGERRLVHWGFSLAGPNRFCNPTTALLIILIFIFIHILSILIILIIPIILIILIILFVFIIVLINSFLLSLLSSSSVSFIVLVSNLINIKTIGTVCDLQQLQKNRVRPLPHSDFTLWIPLHDYHTTPALLAFVPPPWPQVGYD